MNSAQQCGAACAAQVIQTAQDASHSARDAANSVSSIVTDIGEMCDIVNNIQDTYSDIEDQVIHLRIDIDQLSSDIHLLKASIDDAMLPTVDNNVLKLVVAIFGAFTICIVICQLIIFYTGRLEEKKEERMRIMVQQRRDVI